MCIKNTHFKCLKSYYRISRVEVTHLFLECWLLAYHHSKNDLAYSKFPQTSHKAIRNWKNKLLQCMKVTI